MSEKEPTFDELIHGDPHPVTAPIQHASEKEN